MINILSTKKVFNNEDYNCEFRLYTSDLSMTLPSKITEEDPFYIPSDYITYIKIENTITTPIPKLTLEIHDDNFGVCNKIRPQNCRISVKISRTGEKTEQEINLLFIIDAVKMLSMSKDRL